MKILSVNNDAFKPYGKVLEGYDTAELCRAKETIAHPETGTDYAASIDIFERLPIFNELRERA